MMIINGTMSEIRIERTRNILRGATELKCPDYQLDGEYPAYNRLEDFMWSIISKQVIPSALHEEKDFLLDGTMLPANLTVLSESDGVSKYLLTCTDQQLTTTYHVWFTMDEEIFRRSYYKLEVSNVLITVADNVEHSKRKLKSIGITEEGMSAYLSFSEAIWSVLVDSIIIEYEGTEEEDDAMFYVTPSWVDKKALLVRMEKDGSHCHWICELPNGLYRAEATFDLKMG